jgi:hypothetical protein
MIYLREAMHDVKFDVPMLSEGEWGVDWSTSKHSTKKGRSCSVPKAIVKFVKMFLVVVQQVQGAQGVPGEGEVQAPRQGAGVSTPKPPAMLRGEVIHKEGEDYLRGKVKLVPVSFKAFHKEMQELRKAKAIPEGKWGLSSKWTVADFFDWAAAGAARARRALLPDAEARSRDRLQDRPHLRRQRRSDGAVCHRRLRALPERRRGEH